MINNQELSPRRRRGRPRGAVKSYADRLRDRTRTVSTLNELFLRTGNVNNTNQFARWFDDSMRRLHPGRAWETATNNKWRKNFSGHVGLTPDSVAWLNELFPDATDLFARGAGNLWQALWQSASSPEDLWQVYGAEDPKWGVTDWFSETRVDLEIKVFCSIDFEEPIDEEVLGRAVVLRRINEEFGIGTCEDGVAAYLCIKAALAELGIKYAALGVFHEIADFLATAELERVEKDWRYRQAVKLHWAGQRNLGESGVLEYVRNPFLRMSESTPSSRLVRRWKTLAAATDDNYCRSKVTAQNPITVGRRSSVGRRPAFTT